MAALALGPLIGLGSSIFGGLAARSAANKNRQLIAQARQAHYDYYNPRIEQAGAERGETRGRALGAYGDIYGQQGYTPEEAAGMRVSDATRGQVELTPERANMIRSLALAPIGRTFEGLQEEGLRRAAVHGNYAPGMNETLEEMQREKGRQAAETSLGAELGIYREGAGQALALSDRDRAAAEEIANARRSDRALAASGFTGLAGMDTARQGQLEGQRLEGGLGYTGQLTGQPTGMQAFMGQVGQGLEKYGAPTWNAFSSLARRRNPNEVLSTGQRRNLSAIRTPSYAQLYGR